MKRNIKSSLLIAAIIFGTGMSCVLFTGCEDKPKSIGERIEDGLDTRPNEGLKDAGEDIKDAVEDAGDELKDAVKDPG